MAKKTYIINLQFGTWTNQLWFSGEDSEIAQNKWADAKRELERIGDSCSNSNEFFLKAVAHFESCGFTRIQK